MESFRTIAVCSLYGSFKAFMNFTHRVICKKFSQKGSSDLSNQQGRVTYKCKVCNTQKLLFPLKFIVTAANRITSTKSAKERTLNGDRVASTQNKCRN